MVRDSTVAMSTDFGDGKLSIFTRREKLFELFNHLGNELVTVSDRELFADANADGK